ncbi:MAG: pilus assembly protein PilM [Thermoleophilaceae bacterium]
MAISLRKRSAVGTVGLDIDGRFLAAVEVAPDGRLTRVASAELPEGVLVDGEVADRAALSAALKDFVASADLPRNVRLGISNQQIVVRMLELPQIEDQAEREAALRFQAADAIAMPLDEAVLDHQVAGFAQNGDGVERMQVVVVAARRTMVEEYLGAARDAGLKPEGIDLDAFAIVRMLMGQVLPDAQPLVPDAQPLVPDARPLAPDAALPADEAPTVVLDDEPPTVVPDDEAPTVVVPEDGTAAEPAVSVAVPAASADPSAEPEAPSAARVYCHLGGVSNLAIAVGPACYFTRTLSTRFDAPAAGAGVADEIRLSIDYYMGQANALPVADALLSGEGARDGLLVSEIGAQLGIPVAAATPLGVLDASAVPEDDDPRRYTVAAGLAIGAAT